MSGRLPSLEPYLQCQCQLCATWRRAGTVIAAGHECREFRGGALAILRLAFNELLDLRGDNHLGLVPPLAGGAPGHPGSSEGQHSGTTPRASDSAKQEEKREKSLLQEEESQRDPGGREGKNANPRRPRPNQNSAKKRSLKRVQKERQVRKRPSQASLQRKVQNKRK